MSESLQPNLNHISYGGQFEVTNNDDNLNEWRTQYDESGSTSIKQCSVPPNFRVWEPAGKIYCHFDTTDGDAALRFRVVSYNVLAQYLLECHPYLYTGCSTKNLNWKIRAERLYDEIISLDPDILCLQEVQASHLSSFYSKFDEIGYCGIFKQKTGHREDGCAIYFKQSLFELEDQVGVEFYQPELPILNRDNIGIMAKLVPRALPRSPIVVATTHLLYNPKRTDVRLAQIQVFLAEIDRFAYFTNGRESGHLPIVLTGDLNSTPDSAVIKLLGRGHVRVSPFRDGSDWQRIGVTDKCQHLTVVLDRQVGKKTDYNSIKIYNSEHCPEATLQCSYSEEAHHSEKFNSDTIGHSLQLACVYDKSKQDGAIEASTYQDYWVTVDYIYFSACSSLKLVERLRLPTTDECEALASLPNDVYGSDHLALAASFELRPFKSSL